jgi:hypothetical protein
METKIIGTSDVQKALNSPVNRVNHGLKLYALQLTPDHIRQAATQLAAGRTAMGPLSELEKAKQLRVSAAKSALKQSVSKPCWALPRDSQLGGKPWQRCSLASTKPPESLVAWLPVSTIPSVQILGACRCCRKRAWLHD